MNEAEPDWTVEQTRDEGRPALATAISSAILLLSTCNRPDRVTASGAETAGYLLGGILFSIAIFWGIPYWITIRKSSRGWKIGSLVVITVLAVLASFGRW